jgi:hypothetical protein
MSATATGPVYQLEVEAEPAVADQVDAWLEGHVEVLLAQPGFVAARSWNIDSEEGLRRTIVQFDLDNEANLRQFLETSSTDYRSELDSRFGGSCHATARVLRVTNERIREFEHCLNCESVLTGQYCGNCGQRSQSRLISIWELVRDAFGDLFELDSRLWRTLIPLATRPGRLTSDYLSGRRARYMPPFRMYLVFSLAFFVIAFFDPARDLGLLLEAPEVADSAAPDTGPGVTAETSSSGEAGAGPADEQGVRVSIDGGDGDELDCNLEDFDSSDWPEWLARRVTRDRVEAACRNIAAEDGIGWEGLFDRAVEYLPAGLIVLLPVMALILKMLHPLSGRYYVEHLLFVIHYHAFAFLVLTVEILFTRTVALLSLPTFLEDASGVAVAVYIPVYLYKSLRRVYGQGRFVTILKFLFLLFVYLVGLALIVGFAALFAAFSV